MIQNSTQKFALRLGAPLALAMALAACDQSGSASSGASAPAASAPAASTTTTAAAPAASAPAPVASTPAASTPAPAAPAASTPAPVQVAQAPEAAPAATATDAASAVAPAARGPLMADAPLGSPDAKVTVIEYASLSCSHCASFQVQTAPAFKQKYVDTGLVQFIFRDFPLGDSAMIGAIAARCDGSPQRYHAFADLLLRRQSEWAFLQSGASIVQEVKRLTQIGGLTGEQIDACINNAQLGQWILDSAREGERLGVNSTPSFVINGRVHAGAMSLDQLSAIIDPLLR